MVSATLLTPIAPSAGDGAVNLPVTRESLSGHILAEISRCNGPQFPCESAEQILSGFWDRHGQAGMTICRQAFEMHHGMWRGAPVTVARFQERHDPYFAIPLLEEAGASQGSTSD